MVVNSKKKKKIDSQLGIGVSLRFKPLTWGHGLSFELPKTGL